MSIVFFLIPLGLVLVAIAVWAFVWAVNHGQFEDLDKAAHSILYDDDEAPPPGQAEPTTDSKERRAAQETRDGEGRRNTTVRRDAEARRGGEEGPDSEATSDAES